MKKLITLEQLNLNFWTKNLFELLPLELDLMVFSGPLLVKAYMNIINQLPLPKTRAKIEFLDLYLTGPGELQRERIYQMEEALTGSRAKSIKRKTNEPNPLYIGLFKDSLVIRIYQTHHMKTSDLLKSFVFAHDCMYCTKNYFYLSSHAEFSIKAKQVYPNFIPETRANLTDLINAKALGFDISEYIKEYPMVSHDNGYSTEQSNIKTWLEISKLCVKYPVLTNGKAKSNPIIQSSGMDLFDFKYVEPQANLMDLIPVEKPHESFLSNGQITILWDGTYKGQRIGQFFKFHDSNTLMLSVQVEQVYLHESIQYCVLSLTTDTPINHFKEIIKFACDNLNGFDYNKQTQAKTCILDSAILSKQERDEFNVENTLLDLPNFHNIISNCINLNKLCFIAKFDGTKKIKPNDNIIGILLVVLLANKSNGTKMVFVLMKDFI
jgi:hypothetical protein